MVTWIYLWCDLCGLDKSSKFCSDSVKEMRDKDMKKTSLTDFSEGAGKGFVKDTVN